MQNSYTTEAQQQPDGSYKTVYSVNASPNDQSAKFIANTAAKDNAYGQALTNGTAGQLPPTLSSLASSNLPSPITSLSSAKGAEISAGNMKDLQTEKDLLASSNAARTAAAVPKLTTDADIIAKLEAVPKSQAQIDADNAHQALVDSYDALTLGATNANNALKDQLLQQYTQQRADLEKLATNANAIVSRAGQRTGGDRYTPEINAGIVTAQAQDGLSKLQDLDAKYTAAVAAADNAAAEKKYTIVYQKMKEISDYKKQAADEFAKQLEAARTTTKAINDKVIQSTRDNAVANLVEQGITDPGKILNYLNIDEKGNQIGDFTSKEVNDALNNLNPDHSAIINIQTEAAKNGADPATLKAIGSSRTTTDAFSAASNYLQSASGQLGEYLQYKRDAAANGITPQDYQTWKIADDEHTVHQKSNEAYGTAFASARGKAAADALSSGGAGITTVVQDNAGNNFTVPVDVAPYVNFSSSGVKYADLSQIQGTAAEKKKIVDAAQAAGIKVILNKNSAADVSNITDALGKIDLIDSTFTALAAANPATRNLFQAGGAKLSTILQSDPNKAAAGVFNDASLDILKALSGVQGFRANTTSIKNVEDSLPKLTDTADTVKQKLKNLRALVQTRETALVGNPSPSDKNIIDSNKAAAATTEWAQSHAGTPEFQAANSWLQGKNSDGTIRTEIDLFNYLKASGQLK